MIAAQLAGEAGEDFEWLTIMEFGERSADAATRGATSKEAMSIRVSARIPKLPTTDPAPATDRKRRWTQQGGPI